MHRVLTALNTMPTTQLDHYRDNTEFSMYRYAQGTCPVAHAVTQNIITMPLHMYLTNEDVQRIADIVNNFVK